MNGPMYVELLQQEAETAHARPRLHDLHLRWYSLSLIKDSHSVPDEKHDLCAGTAQISIQSRTCGL